MSLPPGEVFAGFTIERELGAGGMGVVYLARHPRLPRRVALKLLRTDLGADPSFVGRFRREAETVARLDHPNIVAIDDSGADDGRLWLSMRFIDGDTAAGALNTYEHGMPPERVVHIIEKVASALDFAHRHQVVHRDVKPANILLTEHADGDEERVFLTDFGVAKAMGEIEAQATALTTAGGVVATLDYAAPEQIEGKQLDGRCDVYALGCVLYKLLTSVIPYPGDTLAAKVYARMHRPPPEPSDIAPWLPGGFDAVIAKALALDPDNRYQTCKALAVAARAALRTSPRGNTSTVRVAPPDAEATRTMGERVPRMPDGLRNDGNSGPRSDGNSGPRQDSHSGPRYDSNSGPRPAGPPTLQAPMPPRQPPAQTHPPYQQPMTGRLADTGPRGGYTSAGSLPPDLANLLGPGIGSGQGRPPGPPPAPRPRSRGRRRRALLWLGIVLVVAAIAAAVYYIPRVGIAGNATGTTGSSSSSATPRTFPQTTASSAASSKASSSSAPTTPSSSPKSSVPVVPTLPAGPALDPKFIVVSRQYDNKSALYLVNSENGVVTKPAATTPQANAQNPLVSADRKTIVYLQGSGGDGTNSIRAVGSDGKGDRLLFTPSGDCAKVSRPAWSAANQKQLLVPCGTKDANGADGPRFLQFMDLSGKLVGKPLPVVAGVNVGDDISLSPDGKTVVFWASTSVTAGGGRLYTQATDGKSDPTPLTPAGFNDADPDFSPDGTQIAFRRFVGKVAQIFIIDSGGAADPQPVTGNPASAQSPVWSPDGSQIAYKSVADGTTKPELFVVTVSDQSFNQLVLTEDTGSVQASPAWGAR